MSQFLSQGQNKQVDLWLSDLIGAFTDQIICHPQWLDSPQEKLRIAITAQRLMENWVALRGNQQPMGTDAEAAWYLSTTSLAQPISQAWTRLYLYVFNQPAKFLEIEVPDSLRQENLSAYEMGLLNELKRWLYAIRVKHRAEKQ